jgi:hypothetical protein
MARPDGPPGLGVLSDDAGDTGAPVFTANAPWQIASSGGNLGPKVYRGDSAGFVCADLLSPVLTLDSPATGPQLTFTTRHTLEWEEFGIFGVSEASVGQVEIATAPGFNNWTRLPLTPDYPQPVDLTFTTCDTITDGTDYFSGDHGGYATYTANLTNWAGGDVRIRFRLSGDAFYPSGSWWIDDLQVTNTLAPQACATQPPGPPPIPDGASVPGDPLTVSTSGASLVLNWDASECPPAAVNVYWGHLGDFTTFAGGFCGLAPGGPATVSLPGNVWFVVAGTDGAASDGSWSRDHLGSEKIYSGASAACPAITQHVTNNSCP